jgi:primosomal protein N' (replication factor Y)
MFAKMLREKVKNAALILGPEPPVIARIRNEWLRNILIKVDRNTSVSKVKEMIEGEKKRFFSNQQFHRVGMDINIDPV